MTNATRESDRLRMVERHLAGRDIVDPLVLEAFRTVAREEFLPAELAEFAYEDSPLPIGKGQTISQPYIVAVMAQALRLHGNDRVLEVGTGSGYAAAILGRIAHDVYTVERIPLLAETATERLARLGFTNVHVTCRDGSVGWSEEAPFDAIAVAAGGPHVPQALLEQLAVGGRLVIPVGPEHEQVLVRVTRTAEDAYDEEKLGDVRFVPLIGEQAWGDERRGERQPTIVRPPRASSTAPLVALVRECAEPIDDIEKTNLGPLLDRIGNASLVLLGESTHGTSEFYRMRARITRALVEERGFQFVAVEADWPDAARIDDHVHGGPRRSKLDFTPFVRFPRWMWRNEEVHDFVDWLRAHNARREAPKVGFHGLDLYSLFTSIDAVLSYLDEVDPDAARVARRRYGTLTPWQKDPAAYGEAVLHGRYASAEGAVVSMLRDMLERRIDYALQDGERFFDAAQNAKLVADAEAYYRAMYYGTAASWNLRDRHMYETLRWLRAFYGPNAKGVVWEHNSHVGDASATDMSVRGEENVGELARRELGESAYLVGFGTDHGVVAAASSWGAPMVRMPVVPARSDSYERVFHDTGIAAFALHLRSPRRRALREELSAQRLERAIGVVYRPESERASHYFYADLPRQFDEYLWFDETDAVEPLDRPRLPAGSRADTYPFGR